MSQLVALTGGTGFLGRHVAAAFARAGWRVRSLARRPGPDRPTADVVVGSLADSAALERLVSGADAVVHLAGAIRAPGRAAFMQVNRDGTAGVAAAWRNRAPQARFVLVSSLAAREPGLSDYAASKAAGEAALSGAPAVILRPCAVYGPGDRATLGLFRAARLPVQPVLNGPRARVALIHAADVARAIVAAAGPGVEPATYELSDSRAGGYSWREILAAACRACGTTPRPVRVPRSVLALAGLCGDAAALLGASPMLTSGKRREILHADWSARPEAQPPRALWLPAVGIVEGFAQTADWYLAAGWLGGGRGDRVQRVEAPE